jgi:hypothetical protein
MLELREVFEMVTKQTEPDLDSWKKQEDRQRRASRNRRVGAIVVAVAAAIAIGIFALVTRPSTNQISVNSVSPPPPLAFVTTPPIGPQIVALDGTPVTQLPTSLWGAKSVRLSPDGTTLAYIDGRGAVHTVGIHGSNDQQLTEDGNTNDSSTGDFVEQNHVDWSPDGTKLVYAYSGEIYVMNADGSGRHAVTTDSTAQDGDYYPVWSVNDTIAYYRGSKDQPDGGPPNAEIYTIPVTGGKPKQLTYNGERDIEPAWSPDGTRISWFHDGNLWVMKADGSDQKQIVPKSGFDDAWASAWAPDGTKIAYLDCCTHTGSPTLLSVRVYDFRTKQTKRVGRLDASTDGNGPQWVSNDELLINRYN